LGILATIRADFAFIGASGLDAEEGCSSTQLFEAEMTRAILARATRKILLADGAKWGVRASSAARSEVNSNDWMTDKPRTGKKIGKLKSFGLDLHIAA
jgi:DeoR family transcriptional regulator, aga operon transcriptional repressor